jgi:hypothetical protein
MNIERLEKGMQALQKDLSAGLFAASIFGKNDGLELVTVGPPGLDVGAANALFNNIMNFVDEALIRSDISELGDYLILEQGSPEAPLLGVIACYGEYRWGALVDLTKVSLGIVLNVAIPGQVKTMKESLELSSARGV